MSLDQDQFELALKACASEPIHLIGQLQPHGGLLAFSANAPHLRFFKRVATSVNSLAPLTKMSSTGRLLIYLTRRRFPKSMP